MTVPEDVQKDVACCQRRLEMALRIQFEYEEFERKNLKMPMVTRFMGLMPEQIYKLISYYERNTGKYASDI